LDRAGPRLSGNCSFRKTAAFDKLPPLASPHYYKRQMTALLLQSTKSGWSNCVFLVQWGIEQTRSNKEKCIDGIE